MRDCSKVLVDIFNFFSKVGHNGVAEGGCIQLRGRKSWGWVILLSRENSDFEFPLLAVIKLE